jgi:hypothetical protein
VTRNRAIKHLIFYARGSQATRFEQARQLLRGRRIVCPEKPYKVAGTGLSGTDILLHSFVMALGRFAALPGKVILR